MRVATRLARVLLLIVLSAAACNETMTQLPGADDDDDPEDPPWQATHLLVSALAVGGTTGVDTTFTRGEMTAILRVRNDHGNEVGRMDVTVLYEFSELSDSVELVAPGVYRLADPELVKVSRSGSATVVVEPNGEGTIEVPLGTPRPLTEMSASRHFLLSDASITGIRLHGPDTLNAAALIRSATNERNETRLVDFGHLGIVFAGLVLPALVPGEVSVVGGTLESTSTTAGGRETVWDYSKASGSTGRIVFDVFNQATFTVPAGVPWVISYDAAEPLLLDGETHWPQVTLVQGVTGQAIAPGATLSIDTGIESELTEDPANLPEYVVIADTRSVARVYPIILAGAGVRAWLNVTDQGSKRR